LEKQQSKPRDYDEMLKSCKENASSQEIEYLADFYLGKKGRYHYIATITKEDKKIMFTLDEVSKQTSFKCYYAQSEIYCELEVLRKLSGLNFNTLKVLYGTKEKA
jgi:hypothetical protein